MEEKMIKGIVCPKRKGIFTIRECLECAESGENPCDYTASIIRSMIKERMDEEIHVTDLTVCPRQKILKRKLDYLEKLENLFFKFRGTGLHLAVEFHSTKNLLTEYDVQLPLHNEKIVGRIDEIDIKNKILRDYKTTADFPFHPYEAHKKQVNLYKYIYEKTHNDSIRRLELVYISMRGVKKFNVDIEDDVEIKNFIINRIKAIQEGAKDIVNSLAEFGPLCSYCPEEVKRYCRAIEIRKHLETMKKTKKLPDLEEIIASMPENIYAMD
jgi:CRISPR/Cas system-associated exonuclease Cas4 (RecB family)